MSYNELKGHWMNRYPAIADLEKRAKKKVPPVAWTYLESGTGVENLTTENKSAFSKYSMVPKFCKGILDPNLKTQFLGKEYNSPFGVAPIGLTSLMWPKAEHFLAQSAVHYRIPFCLSTLATSTPEAMSNEIGDMGWFQLYPPYSKSIRTDMLDRAKCSGFHTLVVTADVPIASRRESTFRAGMTIPPQFSLNLLLQGLGHPSWTWETIKNGVPSLKSLRKYTDKKGMKSTVDVVSEEFRGSLDWTYCQELRKEWKGPLLIKGLLHPADVEKAIEIGYDGVVVSNHGGRQFDGAPTSLEMLPEIVKVARGKIAVVFDSGIRTGLDMVKALSLGADFVLLGRAFIYGVAALGRYGGHHAIEILNDDLKNNMMQLGVENIKDLQSIPLRPSFTTK